MLGSDKEENDRRNSMSLELEVKKEVTIKTEKIVNRPR